jgi:hypothetical protein
MKTPTTKEERQLRDADFERRLQPRMLWPSTEAGTAIRTARGYRAKPSVQKRKATLTEAQDNAIGRALRRRQNRRLRSSGIPHAKR